MLNRRSFFGGLACLVGWLPFVWKKKVDESAIEKLQRFVDKNGITRDELLGEVTTDRWWKITGTERNPLDETVSWIPVTERLPEPKLFYDRLSLEPDGHWGPGYATPELLVKRISTGEVTTRRYVKYDSGYEGFNEYPRLIPELKKFSHWAEMPKGPQA